MNNDGWSQVLSWSLTPKRKNYVIASQIAVKEQQEGRTIMRPPRHVAECDTSWFSFSCPKDVPWGHGVWVVEMDGSLRLVDQNFDSSD